MVMLPKNVSPAILVPTGESGNEATFSEVIEYRDRKVADAGVRLLPPGGSGAPVHPPSQTGAM